MNASQDRDGTDLPYWIDDPLIDRSEHALLCEVDDDESQRRGYQVMSGSCRCARMTVTPLWDWDAVAEAYDTHMAWEQWAVRQPRPDDDAPPDGGRS